ncbi:hypothetical protein Btru_057697 [Bulinus truncatus]|nr:hypothetical protein Btru_057697 [Bulinus truncatus]
MMRKLFSKKKENMHTGDHHSVHSYESLVDLVETSSITRLEAARQYFQDLDPEVSIQIYRDRLMKGSIMLAIGIITIKRMKETDKHESLGYLPPSAAHMDRILKNHAYFNSSVPFICNVDAFPSTHFDAVNLYKLLPYTERYGNNSLGILPLNIPKTNRKFIDLAMHKSKYHKETLDYTFCLLSAAVLNPRYVLLLEEDTIAHEDFPDVLQHLIQFRLNSLLDQHRKEFGYLKLYFPLKWQGFAFEFTKLVDLFSYTVLGTAVVSLGYYLTVFKSASFQNLNSLLSIAFCVTLITCLLIGRQNIIELRRLSKHFYRLQSLEGCCTQAMLYPPSTIQPLSEHLVSSASNKHTDLAILDFMYSHSLRTLQVEPNLFFHTGLYTSLELGHKHPEEFIFHE